MAIRLCSTLGITAHAHPVRIVAAFRCAALHATRIVARPRKTHLALAGGLDPCNKRTFMYQRMDLGGQHNQILDAVVGSVTIDVMHMFIFGKSSANVLLHNPAVLVHLPASRYGLGQLHVPTRRYRASTLPVESVFDAPTAHTTRNRTEDRMLRGPRLKVFATRGARESEFVDRRNGTSRRTIVDGMSCRMGRPALERFAATGTNERDLRGAWRAASVIAGGRAIVGRVPVGTRGPAFICLAAVGANEGDFGVCGTIALHVEPPVRCAKPQGVSAPLRHFHTSNYTTGGVRSA